MDASPVDPVMDILAIINNFTKKTEDFSLEKEDKSDKDDNQAQFPRQFDIDSYYDELYGELMVDTDNEEEDIGNDDEEEEEERYCDVEDIVVGECDSEVSHFYATNNNAHDDCSFRV